jgi:heme/copper-type cytochrome/quinol oxidase subunit 4
VKVLQLSQDFFYFWEQIRKRMIKGYFLFINLDIHSIVSGMAEGFEKETLTWIILVLAVPYLLALLVFIYRNVKNGGPYKLSRFLKIVKLEITLEKDKPLRPQVLTMTIRNVGKNDADINCPVLEFRKIWTTRKFKLSGISGQPIYPMFIYPGKAHQLRIEVANFHQYDRSIRKFYWARILLSDVDGRKWKSNKVKLRKSLVT